MLTNNGGCKEKIRHGLAMVKDIWMNSIRIWNDTDITETTKLGPINTFSLLSTQPKHQSSRAENKYVGDVDVFENASDILYEAWH